MKTVVVGILSGAALAFVLAGSACQSSSSGSDSTGAGAGTGTGGTSAAGTSSAGGTSAAGTSATGGTSAAGTSSMGGTSAAGTTAMGGTTAAGGSGTAGSDATGGAAGAKCSTVTTLHPPNADAGTATLYCPFANGGAGAPSVYCHAQMEHCCEGAVGEATMCAPLATPCPQAKPTDWVCEDPADCPSGSVCCSNPGASIGLGDPGCGNFASKMTGTLCAKSCDATSIQICTSDAQCGAGKTCIPFGKSGNQVGGCSKLALDDRDRGGGAFGCLRRRHFGSRRSTIRSQGRGETLRALFEETPMTRARFLLASTLASAFLAFAAQGGCASSDSSATDDPGSTSAGGSDATAGGTSSGGTSVSGTGGSATAGSGLVSAQAGASGTASAGKGGASAAGSGGTTAAGNGGTTAGSSGSGTAGSSGTGGSGKAGSSSAGAGGTGGASGAGTGGNPVGGSAGTGGAGGLCSKVTTLHPPNPDAGAATVYCPFANANGGAGGFASVYCQAQTEHCCEGGVGDPTMCLPLATACPQAKPTDWVCEDPSDCPSGQQCCSNPGASIGLGDPGCGNFASKMTGTLCSPTCDPTSIKMCTSDAECGPGKTCIPFGKAGNQVGGCSKLAVDGRYRGGGAFACLRRCSSIRPEREDPSSPDRRVCWPIGVRQASSFLGEDSCNVLASCSVRRSVRGSCWHPRRRAS